MRVSRAHLGAAPVISASGAYASDSGITPPTLYIGVPQGYPGALPTGVIPGNVTGATQPTGPGGEQCDPVTDPNCYTQLEILKICTDGGGTWDYGNQACIPPKPSTTNYTPILIGGAFAIVALILVMMVKR